MKTHTYKTQLKWTGNNGSGTSEYTSYERSHTIAIKGKPEMQCSSDAAFRGDGSKYNPEELLLSSISSCHMLWYLHLCADNKIVVVSYEDDALAIMHENPNGSGQFSEVVLRPKITVTEKSMV